MATTRHFAYNIGSPFIGATQVGNLAIGIPSAGFESTGLEWWNGPDEELGYVIAVPVSNDSQPTNVPEDQLFLSPTYKSVDISLSNNNQTSTQIFSYQQSVLGETLISGIDKVMFSVKFNSTNPSVGIGGRFIGVGLTAMNYNGNPFGGYPGNDTNSIGFSDDGNYYFNGSSVVSGLPTWTDGDIIDIAIASGLYWWVRVNGGNWNNNPSANPTTVDYGLPLNGIVNAYPVLCPYIYGTMEVLNNPTYGYPSGYNFLGNVRASVGFFRTGSLDEAEFINLVKVVTGYQASSGADAKTWLNSNGYWTSYSDIATSVLSLDAANYTSGNWVDSVGGKSFTLYNSPTWSPSNGGHFNFNTSLSQYAECNTSLPNLGTWSVAVWHYYDGTNTGGNPCIVTEVYPGSVGQINYSLGDNNGGFSNGFFNGGWRVTDGYTLTSNNWYYIVGTYDGTIVKLYVNNALVDSTSYTGTPISSQGGIRLMTRWDLPNYWGGKLATVDIYNKALSNSEIESIWNLTKSRFGL